MPKGCRSWLKGTPTGQTETIYASEEIMTNYHKHLKITHTKVYSNAKRGERALLYKKKKNASLNIVRKSPIC